jgi:hypothetical protein
MGSRTRPTATAAAVGRLTRAGLGDHVEARFSDACHAATAGNPFYVVELPRALREDRVRGVASEIELIAGGPLRANVGHGRRRGHGRGGRCRRARRPVRAAGAVFVV